MANQDLEKLVQQIADTIAQNWQKVGEPVVNTTEAEDGRTTTIEEIRMESVADLTDEQQAQLKDIQKEFLGEFEGTPAEGLNAFNTQFNTLIDQAVEKNLTTMGAPVNERTQIQTQIQIDVPDLNPITPGFHHDARDEALAEMLSESPTRTAFEVLEVDESGRTNLTLQTAQGVVQANKAFYQNNEINGQKVTISETAEDRESLVSGKSLVDIINKQGANLDPEFRQTLVKQVNENFLNARSDVYVAKPENRRSAFSTVQGASLEHRSRTMNELAQYVYEHPNRDAMLEGLYEKTAINEEVGTGVKATTSENARRELLTMTGDLTPEQEAAKLAEIKSAIIDMSNYIGPTGTDLFLTGALNNPELLDQPFEQGWSQLNPSTEGENGRIARAYLKEEIVFDRITEDFAVQDKSASLGELMRYTVSRDIPDEAFAPPVQVEATIENTEIIEPPPEVPEEPVQEPDRLGVYTESYQMPFDENNTINAQRYGVSYELQTEKGSVEFEAGIIKGGLNASRTGIEIFEGYDHDVPDGFSAYQVSDNAVVLADPNDPDSELLGTPNNDLIVDGQIQGVANATADINQTADFIAGDLAVQVNNDEKNLSYGGQVSAGKEFYQGRLNIEKTTPKGVSFGVEGGMTGVRTHTTERVEINPLNTIQVLYEGVPGKVDVETGEMTFSPEVQERIDEVENAELVPIMETLEEVPDKDPFVKEAGILAKEGFVVPQDELVNPMGIANKDEYVEVQEERFIAKGIQPIGVEPMGIESFKEYVEAQSDRYVPKGVQPKGIEPMAIQSKQEYVEEQERRWEPKGVEPMGIQSKQEYVELQEERYVPKGVQPKGEYVELQEEQFVGKGVQPIEEWVQPQKEVVPEVQVHVKHCESGYKPVKPLVPKRNLCDGEWQDVISGGKPVYISVEEANQLNRDIVNGVHPDIATYNIPYPGNELSNDANWKWQYYWGDRLYSEAEMNNWPTQGYDWGWPPNVQETPVSVTSNIPAYARIEKTQNVLDKWVGLDEAKELMDQYGEDIVQDFRAVDGTQVDYSTAQENDLYVEALNKLGIDPEQVDDGAPIRKADLADGQLYVSNNDWRAIEGADPIKLSEAQAAGYPADKITWVELGRTFTADEVAEWGIPESEQESERVNTGEYILKDEAEANGALYRAGSEDWREIEGADPIKLSEAQAAGYPTDQITWVVIDGADPFTEEDLAEWGVPESEKEVSENVNTGEYVLKADAEANGTPYRAGSEEWRAEEGVFLTKAEADAQGIPENEQEWSTIGGDPIKLSEAQAAGYPADQITWVAIAGAAPFTQEDLETWGVPESERVETDPVNTGNYILKTDAEANGTLYRAGSEEWRAEEGVYLTKAEADDRGIPASEREWTAVEGTPLAMNDPAANDYPQGQLSYVNVDGDPLTLSEAQAQGYPADQIEWVVIQGADNFTIDQVVEYGIPMGEREKTDPVGTGEYVLSSTAVSEGLQFDPASAKWEREDGVYISKAEADARASAAVGTTPMPENWVKLEGQAPLAPNDPQVATYPADQLSYVNIDGEPLKLSEAQAQGYPADQITWIETGGTFSAEEVEQWGLPASEIEKTDRDNTGQYILRSEADADGILYDPSSAEWRDTEGHISKAEADAKNLPENQRVWEQIEGDPVTQDQARDLGYPEDQWDIVIVNNPDATPIPLAEAINDNVPYDESTLAWQAKDPAEYLTLDEAKAAYAANPQLNMPESQFEWMLLPNGRDLTPAEADALQIPEDIRQYVWIENGQMITVEEATQKGVPYTDDEIISSEIQSTDKDGNPLFDVVETTSEYRSHRSDEHHTSTHHDTEVTDIEHGKWTKVYDFSAHMIAPIGKYTNLGVRGEIMHTNRPYNQFTGQSITTENITDIHFGEEWNVGSDQVLYNQDGQAIGLTQGQREYDSWDINNSSHFENTDYWNTVIDGTATRLSGSIDISHSFPNAGLTLGAGATGGVINTRTTYARTVNDVTNTTTDSQSQGYAALKGSASYQFNKGTLEGVRVTAGVQKSITNTPQAGADNYSISASVPLGRKSSGVDDDPISKNEEKIQKRLDRVEKQQEREAEREERKEKRQAKREERKENKRAKLQENKQSMGTEGKTKENDATADANVGNNKATTISTLGN